MLVAAVTNEFSDFSLKLAATAWRIKPVGGEPYYFVQTTFVPLEGATNHGIPMVSLQSSLYPRLVMENGVEARPTPYGEKTLQQNLHFRRAAKNFRIQPIPGVIGSVDVQKMWKVKSGVTYYLYLDVLCKPKGFESYTVALILEPLRLDM